MSLGTAERCVPAQAGGAPRGHFQPHFLFYSKLNWSLFPGHVIRAERHLLLCLHGASWGGEGPGGKSHREAVGWDTGWAGPGAGGRGPGGIRDLTPECGVTLCQRDKTHPVSVTRDTWADQASALWRRHIRLLDVHPCMSTLPRSRDCGPAGGLPALSGGGLLDFSLVPT